MFDIKYMFDFFRNPFKVLKEKEQDQIRNLNNYNILLEMLLNMFEYEKSEEYKNIDDETIEKCLIMSGMCGFTKIDNLGIYSDIEEDTNFLIMIKALKDLLIKENIITKVKYC